MCVCGGGCGCERRIEVFVMKKKLWGCRVGGVRLDVNEEVKFL